MHSFTKNRFAVALGESARLLEQFSEKGENFLRIGEEAAVLNREIRPGSIEDVETHEVKSNRSIHLAFQTRTGSTGHLALGLPLIASCAF